MVPSSSRFQHFYRAVQLALALLVGVAAYGQEVQEQPTPFSVWLDFKTLAKGVRVKTGLPIWIESIERGASPNGERASIRLRLRRLGPLNDHLQLRLYFTDLAGKSPFVTGWTETGSQPFASPPLGEGLGVETSETLMISSAGLDYLDIEVPGDGKNLRGVFLTSLRKEEVWRPLDFSGPPSMTDAFGAPAKAETNPDDFRLFGRVRATLDDQPLKIDPKESVVGTYEFSIASRPLLASVTFDILGASPLDPIAVYLNDEYVGSVNIAYPDLADPGYRGVSAPLERDLRIRYTGWLKAQVMIPGSRMVGGLNSLTFRVHDHTSPIVIRAVEIQMKQLSRVFQYDSQP